MGQEVLSAPNSDCDAGIIATGQHQPVVQVLQGVDLAL